MKIPAPSQIRKDTEKLVDWYKRHARILPWRTSRDPYRIWISEIMLQQTTVTAVIPYYEKFMTLFPNAKALAEAPLEKVLAAWAGLGYYSRARNLHKAAQAVKNGFPKTYKELLELPGLGPYTAAAVASIAFDEPVGVLDGNVIRVLCRLNGWEVPWWKSAERQTLQETATLHAGSGEPHIVNQALMELGATICTPKSPACLLCPWAKTCVARHESRIENIPLPKPKRDGEIWTWSPHVIIQKGRVALTQETNSPVLKKDWLFPGEFKQVKKKPKSYHVKHGITHHDIYVTLADKPESWLKQNASKTRWVPLEEIAEVNPSSLIRKILDAVNENKRRIP